MAINLNALTAEIDRAKLVQVQAAALIQKLVSDLEQLQQRIQDMEQTTTSLQSAVKTTEN